MFRCRRDTLADVAIFALRCFLPSLSIDMIGPFSRRVSVNREHVDDAKGERHPLPAPGIAQTHIPMHRDSFSPLVAHRIRDCIP